MPAHPRHKLMIKRVTNRKNLVFVFRMAKEAALLIVVLLPGGNTSGEREIQKLLFQM
jgi:hypothetical protein